MGHWPQDGPETGRPRAGGRAVMEWRAFVRFWGAAAALFLTDQVVGAMSIRPVAAIVLAVVLAGAGLLVDAAWPSARPGGPGLTGWLSSSVVLYGAQFAVPFYHVSAFGAVVAGGLVWLLDQMTPMVFG